MLLPIAVKVKCLVYLILIQSSFAFAFDFFFSAPSQCDDLSVSWSGGRPPFHLLITPMFGVSQNISVPDSAYNAGTQRGTFTTYLTLAAGTQFLLTMSDANGFGTGGTSALLATGSSRTTDASCNTTQPAPDFLFQLNRALQQCRTYTFSDYQGAVQPVKITGLIPLGQSFELFPPVGSNSLDWTANVAGGTSVAFVMTDANGRNGGSSDMKVVGWTDKSDCIDASSPRSTVTNPATATPNALGTQPPSVRTGVIVGAVIGACVFVALIILFSICLIRRDRRTRHHTIVRRRHPEMVFVNNNGGTNSSRVSRVRSTLMPTSRRRTHASVDLLPSRPTLDAMASSTTSLSWPSEYEPNPFILPSNGSVATAGHSEVASSLYHNRVSRPVSRPIALSNTYSNDITYPSMIHANTRSAHANRRPSLPLTYVSGTTSRKTSMIGLPTHYPRLVLHTDAEDVPVATDEPQAVVELPPQYADRRMTMSPELDSRRPSYSGSSDTFSPPALP